MGRLHETMNTGTEKCDYIHVHVYILSRHCQSCCMNCKKNASYGYLNSTQQRNCFILMRSTPLEMVVPLQRMPLYCFHKDMSGHS